MERLPVSFKLNYIVSNGVFSRLTFDIGSQLSVKILIFFLFVTCCDYAVATLFSKLCVEIVSRNLTATT